MQTDCDTDSLLASSEERSSITLNLDDIPAPSQIKSLSSGNLVENASRELIAEHNSMGSSEKIRKRAATTPKANESKKPKQVGTSRITITANQKVDEACAGYIIRGLSALQDSVPLTDQQPKFLGYGLQHDELWIEPADPFSLAWLKTALDEFNEKSNNLKVSLQEYIPPPPLHRVAGMLPACGQTRWLYSEIIRNITRLNPNFDTKFWRVLAISGNRFSERKHLIMEIDDNSLRELESCNFKIYYRLSQLKLRCLDKKKTSM